MKKLFRVLFRPLTLTLSGIGFMSFGGDLVNQGFDTHDPRVIGGGVLVLLAAGCWGLATLALLVKLFKRLRRRPVASPLVSTVPKPRRRLLSSLILTVLLVGLAALFAGEIGPVADAQTLQHADPSMVALATAAGMSHEGELIFLRTHPEMVSDSQMQSACAANTAANNSNGFIEQGCYVPSENKIYLRTMPDNLHDMVVATAAYEMLHPVYLALRASGEGTAIDQAIEANFTVINDANLNEQVANFAKTEPGERDLELFSLLGTGYANLTPALSKFYAPYFTNLQADVDANNQVKQLFKDSQDKLAQIDGQIKYYDNLANNAYASSVRWANAGSQSMDDYYYNLYRQDLQQENNLINEYNDQLKSYNALVTEFDGTQPVQQINPAQTQSI